MADKNTEKEKLEAVRHSLAHLLAAAIEELWPEAKRAIGPAIENGFYYDFDFTSHVTEKDLPRIEKKMREILKTWDTFTPQEETKDSAQKRYAGNPYKSELIKELAEKGGVVTSYQSGDFIDLCRGGHIKSARDINPDAFALDRIAGAYWRADKKNQMLTRIYGIAFLTKKDLEEYLARREEATKRDHRKLGKELDLFFFSPLVGGGLPLWTPRGTLMRELLNDYVFELRKKHGYQKVEIPHITKKALYEKSGHWEKFQNELLKIKTREGDIFALKPMNCPHHTQIYAASPRSYRELPLRYADTTMVYRDEQSGELSGLSRVRSITQDDAHVFCRKNQIKEEIIKIWDIVEVFYKTFGFPLTVRLSLHDPSNMENYLGDEAIWKTAAKELRTIAKERDTVLEEAVGEAAFYGPKVDFIATDSMDREWQVATIQLDMNLPERFDLTLTNEQGEKERVFMIHAAIMGSIERFLALLIEHTAGTFPLWLSPVQISILPIGEKHRTYATKLGDALSVEGIRVEISKEDETLNKRIRKIRKQKIPYFVVVGDKETESNTLALEERSKKKSSVLSTKDLVAKLKKEINNKENSSG